MYHKTREECEKTLAILFESIGKKAFLSDQVLEACFRHMPAVIYDAISKYMENYPPNNYCEAKVCETCDPCSLLGTGRCPYED